MSMPLIVVTSRSDSVVYMVTPWLIIVSYTRENRCCATVLLVGLVVYVCGDCMYVPLAQWCELPLPSLPLLTGSASGRTQGGHMSRGWYENVAV